MSILDYGTYSLLLPNTSWISFFSCTLCYLPGCCPQGAKSTLFTFMPLPFLPITPVIFLFLHPACTFVAKFPLPEACQYFLLFRLSNILPYFTCIFPIGFSVTLNAMYATTLEFYRLLLNIPLSQFGR